MMRTLILGATGFVGSYLMERCLERGDEVFGTHYNATIDSADWAAYSSRLMRCDIRYFEQVRDALRWSKPEIIYLLAAQSYPALSWRSPAETLEVNVCGTANVFEAMKAEGVNAVVVVACSSAQYGDVDAADIPVKEEHPQRPLHPYGVSKAATEMLSYQYWVNDRIRAVPVRIFNTTGPRKTGDVCADFTSRMVRIELGLERPVLKVGNLETLRAITDVRDLANALELVAAKATPGTVYNISGERTYRIGDILEIVKQSGRVDVEIEVDQGLLRPSDEKVIFGDSSRLRAATGWKQQVPIEVTIADMMDYWRSAFTPRGAQK